MDIWPNTKARQVPEVKKIIMKIFFLNMGHAATPHRASDGCEVRRVDYPLPNISDPSDPAEVDEVAMVLLWKQADEIRSVLLNGELIVMGLLGAAGIAVGFIAALAGLLGFMPRVLVATRTETGFLYDLRRAFDLYEVREAARRVRQELVF